MAKANLSYQIRGLLCGRKGRWIIFNNKCSFWKCFILIKEQIFQACRRDWKIHIFLQTDCLADKNLILLQNVYRHHTSMYFQKAGISGNEYILSCQTWLQFTVFLNWLSKEYQINHYGLKQNFHFELKYEKYITNKLAINIVSLSIRLVYDILMFNSYSLLFNFINFLFNWL